MRAGEHEPMAETPTSAQFAGVENHGVQGVSHVGSGPHIGFRALVENGVDTRRAEYSSTRPNSA